MTYTVSVGGTSDARKRWPIRTYKHRRPAERRRKQIRDARDIGVVTIWTWPVEEKSDGRDMP